MHLSLQTLYCFLAATYVAAVPTTMSNNLPRADPPISGSPLLSQRVPRSNNTPLRIMPLGNSITWGYLSTSGNGYRQPLLSLLSANHTKIQYIGSQRSGNMTNNQNEGHPGATISQITSYANLSLPQQPNLILMMAGTNDMAQDNQTATAPQRLGALIDECHNGVSKENGGTAILVAQLTPAADNGTESRIQAFNAQVPGVVDERAKKGMKVLTVNMSQYVTVGDLKDGLHPSDEGYAKMAKAWYDGIGEAIGRGWIEAPVLILGP